MKIKAVFISMIFLWSVGLAYAKEPSGNVIFMINLNVSKDSKTARLWLPYPQSDECQAISNVEYKGNYSKLEVSQDPEKGFSYLYAQWQEISDRPWLRLSFTAKTGERAVRKLGEADVTFPPEVKKYLASNEWLPTHGKVKEIADAIVTDKKGILAKSRAVYDWVVENTRRLPEVKGCGAGIFEQALAQGGGKCADISTLYVALARAAGIPAREVFGLRLGKKPEEDITAGYHCWAEFYLPGTGWVSVDPADVRKAMLVENLNLQQAKPYREYFWGRVDEHRIILGRGGRGIRFKPPQEGKELSYFMYPYAEVDGKPLDYLEPKTFSYSISFKSP